MEQVVEHETVIRAQSFGPGRFQTLEQFIIAQQQSFPHATGPFSRLVRDISVAAKIVNRDIRRAGLLDVFGDTGEINVQGEQQQKLDLSAHNEFVRALRRGGECCLIGSEEDEHGIVLETHPESEGRYIVLFDPLDGSSNIDVNVSVGTIFSIYLVECRDGRLYTGIATDVDRRLAEHEAGDRGAKFLRGKGPLKLVYRQTIGSRSLASRVESRVKRLSRNEKSDVRRLERAIGEILEDLDR